jgi:DNA segregation ATPase FtsK/SpoIIIE, S-DNA-T family
MASETPKTNTFRKKNEPKPSPKAAWKPGFSLSFAKDQRIPLTLGIIFLSFSIFLFFAFVSYIFSGKADQSLVASEIDQSLRTTATEARNWLGLFGAKLSDILIRRWFGLAAFFLPPYLFLLGFKLTFKKSLMSLSRFSSFALFFVFWLGLTIGYLVQLADGFTSFGYLSGGFGYELGLLAQEFLGWGSFILILGSLIIFLVFYFDISQLNWSFKSEPAAKPDRHWLAETKEKTGGRTG